MFSLGRLIRRLWFHYFSTTACDRPLFQAVSNKAIRSVVEIGIADVARTRKLWDALAFRRDNLPLRYTGIDLFESRPQGQPVLSLKQAYSELRRDRIEVKLVPGDPASALHRTANTLTGTDLLIIAATLDANDLARAWTWMPRMLHAGTIVFQEVRDAAGATTWQRLSIVDIQQRAKPAAKSGRKAA
jgi:hypothetical protein